MGRFINYHNVCIWFGTWEQRRMNHLPLQCRIMRQTLSNLTFLPHQIKTAVPNWFRRHSFAVLIGSLSKDVFERPTSTGSEAFSLFIRLDTTKFVLPSFFSPIKTIYLRVSTKPQPNAAKSPLPVDVRRSKTLLLKLPNTWVRFGTWVEQRLNRA